MDADKYCVKHKLNYIDNEFGNGCPVCNKEKEIRENFEEQNLNTLENKQLLFLLNKHLDRIHQLEKQNQELTKCLLDGMNHNIEYGCLIKCSIEFKSEECQEKCSKMKKIRLLEKITGKPIDEII